MAVDGTRIRSQGSRGARRRRQSVEQHLEQAREAVKKLSAEANDEDFNRRRQAAKLRAARERFERLTHALDELQAIEAGKRSAAEREQARMNEREPEARPQRESNGGGASGYNAQLATDVKEKIVVGVELTNNAADQNQLLATLANVKQRLKQTPKQVLADQGYSTRDNIAAMEADQVEYATPVPALGKGSKSAYRAAGIQAGSEPKFFIYDQRTDGGVS